jgi:hypothetical protein
MSDLYYKDGTKIKVLYEVDRKELLATGEYFEEKPVNEAPKTKRGPKPKPESEPELVE